MTVHITSDDRMSNRQYHLAGKPKWWVRLSSGDTAKFVRVPETRGDAIFDCEVEVPDVATELTFGVGPKGDKGLRYTMTLIPPINY